MNKQNSDQDNLIGYDPKEHLCSTTNPSEEKDNIISDKRSDSNGINNNEAEAFIPQNQKLSSEKTRNDTAVEASNCSCLKKICSCCCFFFNCLSNKENQNPPQQNLKSEINNNNKDIIKGSFPITVGEFKIQSRERFFIEKNQFDENKNNLDDNLIQKNKELEGKLKQMEEENKNLKTNNKNYDELENKYKKIIEENEEFQNKAKNTIEVLMKLEKISNQSKKLITHDRVLFKDFKNIKIKDENIYTDNNDFLDYNKAVKLLYSRYLRYLFLKKSAKKIDILYTYFNKYKEIANSLKLLEEEENLRLRKNKRLRDLFYNKIIERKNRIHRYFTRFYYKGLLSSMKVQEENNTNNTNTQLENNNPATEEHVSNENNENKTESKEANETNNTDSELKKEENENKEKKEENKENENIENEKKEESEKKVTFIEEEPKNEEKKEKPKQNIGIARTKSRNLRKFLNQRNKERVEILRKYFFRFQCNGIMACVRRSSRRFSQSGDEKMKEAIKAAQEQMEKEQKIEEEKANKINQEEEEQKKINEEKFLEKVNKLKIIVIKKDRHLAIIKRKYFGKWNLTAKILGLKESIGVANRRRAKTIKLGGHRGSKKIKKTNTIKKSNNEIEDKKVENVNNVEFKE